MAIGSLFSSQELFLNTFFHSYVDGLTLNLDFEYKYIKFCAGCRLLSHKGVIWRSNYPAEASKFFPRRMYLDGP